MAPNTGRRVPGQFLPPPTREPGQSIYNYNLLYGFWLRTGGSNSPGGGFPGIIANLTALQAEADTALRTAFMGMMFGDEIDSPKANSNSTLISMLFGDELVPSRSYAQAQQVKFFGGNVL